MSIKMCVSFFTYLSPGSHEPGRLIERWWGPKPKRETETHQALYSGWKAVCLLCHSLVSLAVSDSLNTTSPPFFLPSFKHLQTLFCPGYHNKENQQHCNCINPTRQDAPKEVLWYVREMNSIQPMATISSLSRASADKGSHKRAREEDGWSCP